MNQKVFRDCCMHFNRGCTQVDKPSLANLNIWGVLFILHHFMQFCFLQLPKYNQTWTTCKCRWLKMMCYFSNKFIASYLFCNFSCCNDDKVQQTKNTSRYLPVHQFLLICTVLDKQVLPSHLVRGGVSWREDGCFLVGVNLVQWCWGSSRGVSIHIMWLSCDKRGAYRMKLYQKVS